MFKKVKIFLVGLILKIKHTLIFLKKRKKRIKDTTDDIYPLF